MNLAKVICNSPVTNTAKLDTAAPTCTELYLLLQEQIAQTYNLSQLPLRTHSHWVNAEELENFLLVLGARIQNLAKLATQQFEKQRDCNMFTGLSSATLCSKSSSKK